MPFLSINPATGEELFRAEGHRPPQVEAILEDAANAAPAWGTVPIGERAALLGRLAEVLEARRDEFARLATLEMGKLPAEARAEVEKCVAGVRYYAAHAEALLADEVIATDAADSRVVLQPLGTVLAIMPWNFPYWQVIRCTAPALAVGNTVLLKHAAHVPQCAFALERAFEDAGFPDGVFRTLLVDHEATAKLIADPRIHAVSLTGSERAGKSVAAAAGRHLKKCVLELGGSDAFIVLADADLERAVGQGVKARFQNAGQSCIAAKRFLVVEEIADAFVERFTAAAAKLRPGDPLDPATTLAPLARVDLRDTLHAQVTDALARGATARTGGTLPAGPGAFYPATVLEGIAPGMRAWSEELFGPVALVIRVRDAEEAIAIANGSEYGLGGSVWTRDTALGERLARRLECGAAFVNGLVKSDPRLPFGGIKSSGYGRELARQGLLEFANVKTLWRA